MIPTTEPSTPADVTFFVVELPSSVGETVAATRGEVASRSAAFSLSVVVSVPFDAVRLIVDCTSSEISDSDMLPYAAARTVSFTLANVGGRAGAEVAQLYLRFPKEAGEPPLVLRRFEKVTLQPGASAAVTFKTLTALAIHA